MYNAFYQLDLFDWLTVGYISVFNRTVFPN